MSKLIPMGNQFGLPDKPQSLMRVAIYARKSDKTEGKSKSLREQVESCQKVCGCYGFAPENIVVYAEEEGQKGHYYWRDDEGHNPAPWRPELTRLMNDIELGRIDVVIVWRSDRLYRDSGVCDALMKVFRTKEIKFICGNRDMDVNSATGLYQASVEAANNRRYRDQTSEDIKRDHDFKAESGFFTRNPSCLGFRSKGKGSQAVEPMWGEIELINRIYRLFVHGEGDRGPMGINGIANFLMEEGVIVAVGAKGHKPKDPYKIHTSQIRTILTNCMYIGKWRHRGQEFDCNLLLVPSPEGTMQTVVPISLYEAVQKKLKLTDRPGKKSAYSEHLLSGLVICAYCGRPLHVHNDRRRGNDPSKPIPCWYVCNNRKPPRYCKPYGMRMLQEDIVDDWVIQELAPLLVEEIESVRSSAGRDADVQTLSEVERKISDLQKNETRALRDMMGVFDKDQITRVAADFRIEREQLERKSDELRTRLNRHSDFPDISSETLAEMPISAIKDAMRRAVQWIAIGSEGVVVLTSFGTYIGATFRDIDKGTFCTRETRTGIYPPTPAAALRCLKWLPSPMDFIKGRRASIGRRAERLIDEEILPGLEALANAEVIDTEIELVIEEIQLDN